MTADPPQRFKLGQRRCLDGMRGLAIVFVLLSHIPKLLLTGGFIGVDLFFVLSGFLITSLLLEEWAETGGIRLRDFYARRALRLLPALGVMLLVMVLLSAVLEPPAEAAAMRKSALMTLLYSANWFAAFQQYPREHLSPTWSLSVEEQFYVVWPLLLLGMLRWGWSKGAIAGVTAALLLVSAGARALLWSAGAAAERVYFGSDTHADGLLAGALVAMAASWGRLPRSPGMKSVLNVSALLVLAYFGLFVRLGSNADAYFILGGYLLLNLGAAVVVACLVVAPWPPLRLFFEWIPLVWIGRVSYGLYLWHLVVFWWLPKSGWGGGHGHWPIALALTAACAALSYVALERPLLRLKRRFARASSGRPDAPPSP